MASCRLLMVPAQRHLHVILYGQHLQGSQQGRRQVGHSKQETGTQQQPIITQQHRAATTGCLLVASLTHALLHNSCSPATTSALKWSARWPGREDSTGKGSYRNFL